MASEAVRMLSLPVFALLLLASSPATADRNSGCPSLGCLPSATYALSSDVPAAPVIKWTTKVGTLKGGETNDRRWASQGCVSCQVGPVCVTPSGYVAIDQQKGGVDWRYDNLTAPSLPLLDVYGDVIGTNGRRLVKIDGSGKPLPVIKMLSPLDPMYSLQLTSESLFLMASAANGLLVTYGTDGIVEASFTVTDKINNVSGAFLPVAQPVIYGRRAYIIMQFISKGVSPGLQRLYAIDLWARMVNRISVAWHMDLQTAEAGAEQQYLPPAELPEWGTVLAQNGTVYVSLRPTPGGHQQEKGTLWMIRDNGKAPQILAKTAARMGQLSLYDVSLGAGLQDTARAGQENPRVLWVASLQLIEGYNAASLAIMHIIDVTKLLATPSAIITSKVMVAHAEGSQVRLVFGASVTDTGNVTQPYLLCLSLIPGPPSLLWKVAGQAGTDIVGQIANVLLVPPVGKGQGHEVKTHEGQEASVRRMDIISGTPDQHALRHAPSVRDDAEVFLIGTAVSKTTQYTFAVGPK